MKHPVWALALLFTVGTACGDDPPDPRVGQFGPDAGQPDTGPADTGPADTGSPDVNDTGPDASLDTQPDPAIDAGPDLDEPVEPGVWDRGGWIIGSSVQGRPLIVEQFGLDGPVLFLMSAIHGNERSSVTFAERFRSLLLAGLAEQTGLRVVYLQVANPDGTAASKRHNTNDIDLNRNFPAENFDPTGTGGTTPLSEPESRAIKLAVDTADSSGVVSLHCCIPILDYDGPGFDLAQAMQAAMPPDTQFPVGRLGSRPGSVGSYVGLELGLPIITLEFALDSDFDAFDQQDAVEAAVVASAEWVAGHGHVPDRAGVSDEALPNAPLDSFTLAESAGGIPIRVDHVVQGSGRPVLLLAGLLDTDRRALDVAEHVRRVLLSEIRDVPMLLLTLANPDAFGQGDTLNASGVDVANDFFSNTLSSPEAEGLDALFDSLDPRLVVYVGTADADGIASLGVPAELLSGAILPPLDDLGVAQGDLATWLGTRDVDLLELAVQQRWGQGDNQNDDYFPETNAVAYSDVVRRVIKPDVECVANGVCDPLCPTDPDCDCACDHNQYCEAAVQGSSQTCLCDPDCAGGLDACSDDDHCDSWCPDDVDPNCACGCDHNMFCEAAERDSTQTCLCDPNCQGGLEACSADDHCDTWCTEGADPDC